MKKLYILTVIVIGVISVNAQTNVKNQLDNISPVLSQYIDYYLYDLSSNQANAYLSNFNTSGRVLDQWKVGIGLNIGTGLIHIPHSSPLSLNENFELRGNDAALYFGGPNLFGSQGNGELFFRFIDEGSGLPLYDPFTGDKIGFTIPILEGIGTGVGFAPSIIPKLSLGVGFGTEVSLSILPGALKSTVNALGTDIEITKDLIYTIGVRHDALQWVPQLTERKYHLTIGATYNSNALAMSPEIISSVDDIDTEHVKMKNNITEIEYGSSGFGLEALATKELGVLDLSLFASYNICNYYIRTVGLVDVQVANSFNRDSSTGYDSYQFDKLIDVNQSINSFIYGAALQLNLGGFKWGLKYGYGNNTSYAVTSFAFAFGGKKVKSK